MINVQADEPLVTASQIHQLSELIHRDGIDLATAAHRFHEPEDFINPNQVKVVISRNDEALYFSRSPIPYHRDTAGKVTKEWFIPEPLLPPSRPLRLHPSFSRILHEASTQRSRDY